MQPIVDLLVPTYNPGAEHLTIALRSLQQQTYPHWKCFIHDESDRIDCEMIVKPFLSDVRFSFQKSPKRLGIGGNWNACLTQTHHPIVAYLFHDDEWTPEYLERAVAILEKHPSVGLIAIDHTYRIEGDSEGAKAYIALEQWRRKHLDQGVQPGREFLLRWIRNGIWPNVIGEPSFCVLRRSVMDRVGLWNATMPQALDAEYWVRALAHCDWMYEPRCSGYFRVHDDGTTAKNKREGKGLFDRFTILEDIALHSSDPIARRAARAVQGRQLAIMIQRFFKRRREGNRVGTGGSGVVKRFALRHPLIVLRALVQVLFRRGGLTAEQGIFSVR